jgi:hypothetical protein
MATVAIVIGSGPCLYDDLGALGETVRGATVFAVNDMVALAPFVIHHGVSHHPEKLVLWHALRAHPSGHPKGEARVITHASKAHEGISRIWPSFHAPGSSSLLAVRVALALGHPHVIVAGVPLDGSGYLWGERAAGHYDYERYRKAWRIAQDELGGRVTAPSGFLRELLGSPSTATAEVAA